ncbi:MAG: class I SAM-dependent methyltransferase [Sediminibacterium sp.]|nr:class I SAM-dependent methyltransferase [Sediminibacterium sp.]
MSKWQRITDYLNYRVKARTLHGLHSPFVYKLVETLIEDKGCTFSAFERLDAVRQQLLNDATLLQIEDLGAGSNVLKQKERRVKDIARYGITRKRFSEFYFKLINYFDYRQVVELGTSLGLNTLYMANAGRKPEVYSIEGSGALHYYAQTLITAEGVTNVQLIQGNFDEQFPALLRRLPKLDFLLVDGNHTYEATLRYFTMALPYVHEHTLLVFDDIYWSEGMKRAWMEIKRHPRVSVSLDFYYCGLVFFKSGFKEPLHFYIQQP